MKEVNSGTNAALMIRTLAVCALALAGAMAAGAGAAETKAGAAGTGSPGAPAAGAASAPQTDLVWSHSPTELEDLARAALPLHLDIASKWTGQMLVVQDVSALSTAKNRVRLHVEGRIEPLGVPVEADPVLNLSFEPVQGVHTVSLEALTLTLGPLGKVDLSRLLGPWKVRPEQAFVVPVRGGDGIGMQVTIRRLDLTEQGLRVEAGVRYFPPPQEEKKLPVALAPAGDVR